MTQKTFAHLAADEAFYDMWGDALIYGSVEATLIFHVEAKKVFF